MAQDQGKSLFQAKNPSEKQLFSKKSEGTEQLGQVMQQLNSSLLRLRIIEEQSNQLRRRMQVTDQTTLRINKRLTEEVKLVNGDIADMKMNLEELKEKTMLIINELRNTPKKEEFQILQKYIELWEPMNFVTHKEVESIVEDALSKYLKRKEDEEK